MMADDLRRRAAQAIADFEQAWWPEMQRFPKPERLNAELDALAASPAFLAWAIREGARPLTLRGLPDILYCSKPDVAAFLIDHA